MKKEMLFVLEEDYVSDKTSLLQEMNSENKLFLRVKKTEPERMVGNFYCKKLFTWGESGEGCGKDCSFYEPKNKVSGCCKNSNNYSYNPVGEELLLTSKGKLIKNKKQIQLYLTLFNLEENKNILEIFCPNELCTMKTAIEEFKSNLKVLKELILKDK